MDKNPQQIRTQHKCNVCGKWDVWGESWAHFGNLIDEEEGNITKVCSEICKKKFDANPKLFHSFKRVSRNPLRGLSGGNPTPERK